MTIREQSARRALQVVELSTQGLTQQTIAARLNMHQSQVSGILRKARNASSPKPQQARLRRERAARRLRSRAERLLGRRRLGTIPAHSAYAGRCPSEPGLVLYRIPNSQPDGFLSFKLVATLPRTHKANWWLSYSVGAQRMVKNGDCGKLVEHFPEVAAWVRQVIEQVAALEKESKKAPRA